ncbi:hypothetical protein F5051DRAFT_447708 [Lentinula edodes]|nr:hypothetical protein F5051DRAFT_447708 [Lentinula edodes]
MALRLSRKCWQVIPAVSCVCQQIETLALEWLTYYAAALRMTDVNASRTEHSRAPCINWTSGGKNLMGTSSEEISSQPSLNPSLNPA